MSIDPTRFITSVFISTDPEDLKHYVKVIDTKGSDFCFYISAEKSFCRAIDTIEFPHPRKALSKKTLDPRIVRIITNMLETVEFETNLQ